MFQIQSEKEFLNAFRSRDRKVVEPPKGTKFPLFVPRYLSWVDPYGVRVFLVFQAPSQENPIGIAFRRDQQGDKALLSRLCEWCHHSASANEIGLLTTDLDAKRRVGINLCLDLRCGERLETAANLAGRSAVDDSKLLLEKMARFAHEALGIEASPKKKK